MVTAPVENASYPRSRPVGLQAVIGVFLVVGVIALLLLVFYKPFPLVTIINAANHPIENVELQTFGSETQIETHPLGMLTVGEARDVTVRSYEVNVLNLKFELEGEVVEWSDAPLPIKQGESWRIAVEPGGKVTGTYVP